MRHFATIIACLILTACEPYEPEVDGETDARPQNPTQGSNPSPDPRPDPGGAPEPNEKGGNFFCDVHMFGFAAPLPPATQFPNPLGAMDIDGNYVSGDLVCTSQTDLGFEKIDLSNVAPFFVDPEWRVLGGQAPGLSMDSQSTAQYVMDEYGCKPISTDAGSGAWKLLADRSVRAAVVACGKTLETLGCEGGSGPVLNGEVGIGAQDVCNAFMGYHLAAYLEEYTVQLEPRGLNYTTIDPEESTCAVGPVDQTCDFGGTTG